MPILRVICRHFDILKYKAILTVPRCNESSTRHCNHLQSQIRYSTIIGIMHSIRRLFLPHQSSHAYVRLPVQYHYICIVQLQSMQQSPHSDSLWKNRYKEIYRPLVSSFSSVSIPKYHFPYSSKLCPSIYSFSSFADGLKISQWEERIVQHIISNTSKVITCRVAQLQREHCRAQPCRLIFCHQPPPAGKPTQALPRI